MTYDVEKCTWCHTYCSPADMDNGLCPKCCADELFWQEQEENRIYEEAMNDFEKACKDYEAPVDVYED